MTETLRIAFDNSYAALPDRFFARVDPAPPPAPRLLALNAPLAEALGLDPAALAAEEGIAALSGRRMPEGAASIAMAYAGAQFGNFVPQLGDGRAILMGEVIAPDGRRFDIQLKGAGRTPFSRMGDGRAALGPALREYLVSEAMHALGIPTTRALAVLTTGEQVFRDRPLPGAICVRVARAHIRVGTFQYFAARGDHDALRALLTHAAARLHPETADAENPAAAFLQAVCLQQAALIARWLGVGFIHGVMNTDNMSIAGETIDYGPCAFMDRYESGKVFSSIDRMGRYAYGAQPAIGQWNLLQLAQALLPLAGETEEAAIAAMQAALDVYPDAFERAWTAELRRKMGLAAEEEGDKALGDALLAVMEAQGADFTLAFRGLAGLEAEDPSAEAAAAMGYADAAPLVEWLGRWRARLAREPRDRAARAAAMAAVNPAVIPRNHMVEEALAAAETGDMAPFEALHAALASPFRAHPGLPRLGLPPRAGEEVRQTFCGT